MWHIGIDLHREFVVMAAVNDGGEVTEPVRILCEDTQAMAEAVKALAPCRAVIEASGTYRWLYDLLRPYGTVLLAHPLRLRAMIQRRSKTDKLDAQLLANLLRINQIPLAYIPPEPYQQLRDLTRGRARLARDQAIVKIKLRALLARQNRRAPYRVPFGVRGLAWFRKQDFGPMENLVRDELLARLEHYRRQLAILESHVQEVQKYFPQAAVLLDIHGIGLFTVLLIVFDYPARLSLATLDSGRGGDEGRPRGCGPEELLHAGAEAVQREDRAGRHSPKTGGDLLETFTALAA